jgi:hypothetical protein
LIRSWRSVFKEEEKMSVFNRYQNYENETNQDAYEYEKRHYESEEIYRENIRREVDQDYFREVDYE